MPRTSTTTPASSAGEKAGFSLLEMLIVLAIIGLSLILVMPQGEVMMDRVTAHAVFFDFQRQMADLRREAYWAQTPLVLYDTAAAARADPRGRLAPLRSGWSYRLSGPLAISAGGACSAQDAMILKAGREVMRLRLDGGGCRFIRMQEAGSAPASASR